MDFIHTENIGEKEIENNILHELGLKHGTDKATKHLFTLLYDPFLKVNKSGYKNVLEIGILHGASIRMWADYFPNALITGIDIDRHRVRKMNEDPNYTHRVNCITASIITKQDVCAILDKIPKEFELIVDDGAHRMKHQQEAFYELFKLLKNKGIYILEDLHTSYNHEKFSARKENNTMDLLLNFQKTGKMESIYLTPEENQYLSDNIEKIHILGKKNRPPVSYENGIGTSWSSIIIKK